ncbi:sensor histidine kinase [Umezawaea tangerina]|uniref:histidine kinase n=1 Tax=Umezawaea tangerina TaxID=84725 RepID=A0A2T0TG93_9PSEU|nr:histidine kinase [Umezawaea tangerina]PRY44690.1 signal transduction histidine kinase [Umezawaea tangerina]
MRELRRSWPIAIVLVLALGAQVLVLEAEPLYGRQLVALGLAALACVAALCAHRPVVATVCVCASVLVTTTLICGPGRAVFLDTAGVNGIDGFDLAPGRLGIAESVAVLVLVAMVVRTARPPVVVGVVGAVALVCAHATLLRVGLHSWFTEGGTRVVVLLWVLSVGYGVLLRTRDGERAAAATSAVERVRQDERLDLARELHDVVAHYVTGMLVQAQAAFVVSDRDREAARHALPGIITSGTDAVGAMRRLVGTLRDSAAGTATDDLAADLAVLVDGARAAGVPVRARIELPAPVPPELGRSVLRLVQESLTNAAKHARGATLVEVDVELTPTAVRVSVADDGTGRPAHSGGFGLVGMRERVELLRGRFHAGAARTGWLVTAELPLAVHR